MLDSTLEPPTLESVVFTTRLSSMPQKEGHSASHRDTSETTEQADMRGVVEEDEIQTHVRRAQWTSSPSPEPLGHLVPWMHMMCSVTAVEEFIRIIFGIKVPYWSKKYIYIFLKAKVFLKKEKWYESTKLMKLFFQTEKCIHRSHSIQKVCFDEVAVPVHTWTFQTDPNRPLPGPNSFLTTQRNLSKVGTLPNEWLRQCTANPLWFSRVGLNKKLFSASCPLWIVVYLAWTPCHSVSFNDD